MIARLFAVSVSAVLLAACAIHAQEIMMDKSGNIRNVDTRALAVTASGIYLATRDEVYRAADGSGKWESVLALPSSENEIRCLATAGSSVFVGTKRGLLRSQDKGRTWKSVFRTILPEKNNVTAIETSRSLPKRVVIGTQKGIFISDDLGDRWSDISDNLKNKLLARVALNKDRLYAGAEDGLYVRRFDSAGWQRLYVGTSPEHAGEEITSETAYSEEKTDTVITCVAFEANRLYMASGKRLLYSDDDGKSWKDAPTSGMGGSINDIAIAGKSGKLYCATTKGVFELDRQSGQWTELYKGSDKMLDIARIVLDGENENSLWALSERGLYRLESGRYIQGQFADLDKGMKTFSIEAKREPPFEELQKAAMAFADVEPEKIRRWQSESRLKSLLPKISLGVDNKTSTNYEIYTSATKDYIVTGPEDMSKGFDVSVSWELGDLIWSDDQTNIDVRSRLTTQLRNDVLDDLRRAYFERKRLQFELMSYPPKDLKARFDKELRVQELTQAIDDLTGNYLSKHIRR
jgi:photosystem II stability/assembly factor-like uncharacterized protein